MRIFISWSGAESNTLAEFLGTWLPDVLAGIADPFVSSQDIGKGERGMDVVAKELESGTFGLVVVTRDNQDAPWINFEAGALGKTLGQSRVATVLVDLTPADLKGPLSQFQATSMTSKRDVLQLLKSIAKAEETGGGRSLPESSLEKLFETMWPDLEKAVAAAAGGSKPTTKRSELSILEELLDHVRTLVRDRDKSAKIGAAVEDARLTLSGAMERHPSRAGASPNAVAARKARMEEFRRRYGGTDAIPNGETEVVKVIDWQEGEDGSVVLHLLRKDADIVTIAHLEDVDVTPF